LADCRLEGAGNDELDEAVLDATLIFDLEAAQILSQIFYLKHCWVVTDFVEKELKTPNILMLKQLGLRVVTLTGDQIKDIDTLAKNYIGPSIPDLSCLVYARDNHIPLVTRDSALQQAARKEGVKVLDTHDLMVELVREGIIKPQVAADALELIQSQRLVRPRRDWTTLIKQWRKRADEESGQ
jgi:rRNA-processing protein FCF1